MNTRIWVDAEARRVEMEERLRAGETALPSPSPETGTVDEAIREYLEHRETAEIAPRYQIALRDHLKTFSDTFGNRPASSLTVTDMRRYRGSWKIAANTKRVRQVTIRGFLKFVQRADLLDVFARINVPDPEPMPFSNDELTHLLAAADPLSALFIKTGATIGAACIDLVLLSRNTVEGTDANGIMRYVREKTGREALPTISAALKAELLANAMPNGRIFWQRDCTATTAVGVWINRLARLYRECGLYAKSQVCHRLRDSAIQFWFDAGLSVSEVARMAGDNPTTIERHYRAAASAAERARIAAVPARF